MSSVLKITQVFTRTITSSTKSSTNIINNSELKNLKASYNILKSLGEEDYRLFLHANNCSTDKYSDRYNKILSTIKSKIDNSKFD